MKAGSSRFGASHNGCGHSCCWKPQSDRNVCGQRKLAGEHVGSTNANCKSSLQHNNADILGESRIIWSSRDLYGSGSNNQRGCDRNDSVPRWVNYFGDSYPRFDRPSDLHYFNTHSREPHDACGIQRGRELPVKHVVIADPEC